MIKLLVALPLLVGLSHCPGELIPVSDACGVLRATLYQDGSFMLSDDEIDHLTDANQIKIDAVKRYYRKKCVGK